MRRKFLQKTKIPLTDVDNNLIGNNNYLILDGDNNIIGYEVGDISGLRAWQEEASKNLSFNLELNNDIKADNTIVPLGGTSASGEHVYYCGTIDGKGHCITNLELTTPEGKNSTGFIGALGRGGVVSNLKIQGKASGEKSTGMIVGYNSGGIIYNCETLPNTYVYSESEIVNNGQIGGIVGWNFEGIIEDCVNNANVISSGVEQYIGGIAGENYRQDFCVIRNCINKGNISGITHYVGGIVGINHRIIINCHNEGTITGNTYVGGISGMSNDASPWYTIGGYPIYILNCSNSGNIYGEASVGGISGINGALGFSSGGYIIGCFNIGNIRYKDIERTPHTEDYFGGIVGINVGYLHTPNKPENATAEATYGNRIAQIISCYNTGNILAESFITGGIAGHNMMNQENPKGGGVIINCYWSGNTSAGIGINDNPNLEYGECYKTQNVEDYFENMNLSIVKYNNEIFGIIEAPLYYNNITKASLY